MKDSVANRMLPTSRILAVPLAAALITALGCDTEPSPDQYGDAQVDEDTESPRGYELLDTIEIDGATIEFGRTHGGGIAILEEVHIGELSPVDMLMDGDNATPLELYLAVAPPERTVPAALTEAHDAYAAEQGIDSTPRALVYDAGEWAFRGKREKYYAADCDLPDDGAWFDNYWQSRGWNWHYYLRTNDAYLTMPEALITTAVHTHVCNDGPSGSKRMFVKESGGIHCGPGIWHYAVNNTVAAETRRQFRVWNNAAPCTYQLRAEVPIGSGLTPTYSIGISKP